MPLAQINLQNWSGGRRRYIQNAIVPVVDYAETYLADMLGVKSTVTLVSPYVVPRSRYPRAESASEHEIRLFFTMPEIDRKKIEILDKEITGCTAHEMIHSLREAQFPNNTTLLERIASEGLAYTAQAYIEQDAFGAAFGETVLYDDLDGDRLIKGLYDDPEVCYQDITDCTNEELWANDWLYGNKQEPFSWGHRLGIWCVQSMINDCGFDFPQLLQMPAEEIIAL